MRLDDLLRVMREEFAQAADQIDAGLLQWLGDEGADAERHAQAVAAELDRVAQTARIISLEGLGVALEQTRDAALTLALFDADTMGEGLGWLAGWRGCFEACFAAPGEAGASDALVEWLARSPLGLDPDSAAGLRALLVVAPSLPDEMGDELQLVPEATEGDVSLAVPDDVDPDLYETFLADAPAQAARLGDAVRTLVRSGLAAAQIQEAQRVAHTFKGSGNIIGVRGVGRLAHRIEDLIEFAAEQGGTLPGPMGQDLEQAAATLDQMLYTLRGEEEPPQQARRHLQDLIDWVNAIRRGDWPARVADRQAGAAERDPVDAQPSVFDPIDIDAQEWAPSTVAAPDEPNRPATSPAPAVAAEPAEVEAQLRVGVPRLDRLVRRAGQGLVLGGRLGQHLRTVEERLQALDAQNSALTQRLRELQLALEKQGVSLQEKAGADGVGFDPLEMDRYNHLHTLSRFVAELVDDERELGRAARDETQRASAALREHTLQLKDQHRELLQARLVPMRNIVSRLRRTVSQTAAALGRKVRLVVEGEQVQVDSDVLERLTEPLLHLLRNAVDHGIEPADERALYGKPEEGTIVLGCRRDGQTVHLTCRDDGRGVDLGAVHGKAMSLGLLDAGVEPSMQELARLIMLPGFSTRDEVTEVSGRGVGMDVVAERVRAMKGHVDIHTEPLAGSTFTVRVPASTGSVHALIVEVAGELLALPTDTVVKALAAGQGEVQGDRLHHMELEYPLAWLGDWTGLSPAASGASRPASPPAVLVRCGTGTVALAVDRVVDARELILQDVGTLLRRCRGVGGAALQPDGRVLFVLDPDRLESSSRDGIGQAAAAALRHRAQVQRRRVMVVDDAISVRKAVSQLMQDAGYEVLAARDGFDALQQLEHQAVDIVLTDLEMPNLNGLDLTRQLRLRPQLQATPIVMITSRSTAKHRDAALAAGVTRYLTKPYTDQELVGCVRSMLTA